MAIYSYQCQQCKIVFDVCKPIARYAEPEEHCGLKAIKILAAPMIAAAAFFEPFQSPATGKWISSPNQHREDLAVSGCRILEEGESRDFQKKKEELIDKDFEKVAEDLVIDSAKTIGII